MSSILNEAVEQLSNPSMPPPPPPVSPRKNPAPKSLLQTLKSPSESSGKFEGLLKEVQNPDSREGPSARGANRPSTPRPYSTDSRLHPAVPVLQTIAWESTVGVPLTTSSISSSSSDSLSASDGTNPWDQQYQESTDTADPGPCRNFRGPGASATVSEARFSSRQSGQYLQAVNEARALVGLNTGPEYAGEEGSGIAPSYNQTPPEDDNLFRDVDDTDYGKDPDNGDDEEWEAEIRRASEEVDIEANYPESDLERDEKDATATGHANAASGGNTYTAQDSTALPGLHPATFQEEGPFMSGGLNGPDRPSHVSHIYQKDPLQPASVGPDYTLENGASPTESQLITDGFEFHKDIPEDLQIEQFGDKAFRKALRAVEPSLSRKEQWYAWRRVRDDQKADAKPHVYHCPCPANGEICAEDGSCAKLLAKCYCGDECGCDVHYEAHHQGGGCEGEEHARRNSRGQPKCVCGEVFPRGVPRLSQATDSCCGQPGDSTLHTRAGTLNPDAWASVCGCEGDLNSCHCPPDACACENCPKLLKREQQRLDCGRSMIAGVKTSEAPQWFQTGHTGQQMTLDPSTKNPRCACRCGSNCQCPVGQCVCPLIAQVYEPHITPDHRHEQARTQPHPSLRNNNRHNDAEEEPGKEDSQTSSPLEPDEHWPTKFELHRSFGKNPGVSHLSSSIEVDPVLELHKIEEFVRRQSDLSQIRTDTSPRPLASLFLDRPEYRFAEPIQRQQSQIPGLGFIQHSPPASLLERKTTYETHEMIRHSVEPETPQRHRHRESTPAFENRSPSPSPISEGAKHFDIEMVEASAPVLAASTTIRSDARHQQYHGPSPLLPRPPYSSPDLLSSPIMHTVTALETPMMTKIGRPHSRSRSPVKIPTPVPDKSALKSTKRGGGRRKSAVQGSKVEKALPKSRAVSKKVTTAVKNAEEVSARGSKVKDAVAKIEAMAKQQQQDGGDQELTPRRSARIRAMREG